MKIDVSKIKGYADMSAEEKLKALEEYDMEVDYTGYVKKDVYDKKASEAGELSRKLKAQMTEEQVKAKEQEEATALLQKNYETLLRETNISKANAKFLSLGYDEKLAMETAEAYVDGNTEKVFENQKKAQEKFENDLMAKIMKDTKRPVNGSSTDTRSEAEKIAENHAKVSGESAKLTESVLSNYL